MRYVCRVCGYVYDETAEKTPFESLPDTWKCPLCGAPKSQFGSEETKNCQIVFHVKLRFFTFFCKKWSKNGVTHKTRWSKVTW